MNIRSLGIGLTLLGFSDANLSAQTNSWISPLDGNWHDLSVWSAGLLPGTGQTILITNDTSKTVRISPETGRNYPSTLRVGSVTLSSPSNSVNTLLLDSTGTGTSFVASVMRIDKGGAITVLASALRSSEFYVEAGTVVHGASSKVSVSQLRVNENGTYHFTNGLLTAEGEMLLEGTVFNQLGGTNLFTSSMRLDGTYNLSDGRLETDTTLPPDPYYHPRTLTIGGSASFNQSGGIVHAPMALGGQYNLSGGLRTGGDMSPGAGGHILQTGGTNVGAIHLSPYGEYSDVPPQGLYTLQAGEVRSSSIVVGPKGFFSQLGGVHYNDSLAVHGGLMKKRNHGGRRPEYDWVWGKYFLRGGVLVSSNFTTTPGFEQSGGVFKVGHLGVYVDFSHRGGELIVTNITLAAPFTDTGAGTLHHHGLIEITAAGRWFARAGVQQLGPLRIYHWGGVSFPADNASFLHFATSTAMAWMNEATFTVWNWKGSFAGRGKHQLYFGSDSTGLTPEQVAQIQFENPAGLRGTFPARILPDGEVVPVPTRIVSERHSTDLRVYWPSGFILQTSTNVNGPFEDLADALNGAAVPFTDPARFFRMRPEQ